MKKDNTLANNPTMDDDYLFSASCQDCTGLIPSVAKDEYEVENYEDLYPYLPPVPGSTPDIGTPSGNRVSEVGIPPTVPEVGMPTTTAEVGVPTPHPVPGVLPGIPATSTIPPL